MKSDNIKVGCYCPSCGWHTEAKFTWGDSLKEANAHNATCREQHKTPRALPNRGKRHVNKNR